LFQIAGCVSLSFLPAVVQIGFQQDVYNTTEANGAAELCVALSGSPIARNVSVTLFTSDLDAVGELKMFLYWYIDTMFFLFLIKMAIT